MLYFGPQYPGLLYLSCDLKAKLVVDTDFCQSLHPKFLCMFFMEAFTISKFDATSYAPPNAWQLFLWSHPHKNIFLFTSLLEPFSAEQN